MTKNKMSELTAAQFDALTKMLRAQSSRSTAAARLVMVEGKLIAEAMALTDLTQPAVSNALKRYREADAVVRPAYEIPCNHG